MTKKITFLITAAFMLLTMIVSPVKAVGQSDYSTDYTGNITLSTSGGSNASACVINISETGYNGIKAGTSSKVGAVKITVPSGTKYLHLHAAAWSGTTASLAVTPEGYSSNISLTADSGISGNSPFTFSGNASTSSFYKVITFSNALTANTDLTFTAVGGKRFVIWGVTSEEEGTSADVATPTFSPVTGTEFGNEGLSVTISCATENTTIYYTLDGSVPDDESNEYTGAINITTTTTIKAIAYDPDDNTSSVASATYTYVDPNAPGTENNPYTVAQARAAIDAGTGITGVYATGIISQVDSYNSTYSSITYWISSDGTTTSDQLEVYSGKGLNNTNFTAITDVEVGANVVVYGTLKKYGEVYEFDKNNYLTSYTAPIHDVEAPTFAPAAGTYAEAQTVTMSCTTEGAAIHYTTDGTEPDGNSDVYTTGITVSETTTFKAKAIKGENASPLTTATYHFCSAESPYTVAQALAFHEYPTSTIWVHGIVSTAPTAAPNSDGQLTYYISDNGEATNQLQVYKGKGLNNAAFTDQDDIQVGDIVTITGTVKIYNTTTEFDAGNYLTSFERPVEPSITVANATVNVGAEGEEGTLTVTYENITTVVADIWFCNAAGTEDATYDWITASINNSTNNADYLVEPNDGDERTAYFKVWAYDDEMNEVYSNLVTVTQAEYVAPTPSIAVDPTLVEAPADETQGTITVTLTAIANNEIEVQWFESDGTTAATYNHDWVLTDVNTDKNIDYVIGANTGAARTAYFKVYGMDGEANDVYSELVTINQEAADTPVTPHVTWNLSIASYDEITDPDIVTWSSIYATMTNSSKSGGTSASNYLGGDANNRTSSRFYNGNTLTIAPSDGYAITSVVFTATSNGYASTLKNSNWTNATASMEEGNDVKVVTVTPTIGSNDIVAAIGGTCGFIAVTVYYVVDNTPSIAITPAAINEVPCLGGGGTLTVTCTNMGNDPELSIVFCDAQGTAAEYNWISAVFNGDGNVDGTINPNSGAQRTAYLKVCATEPQVCSNIVSITQLAYNDPTTTVTSLPFEFDGSKSEIATTDGIIENGLDDGYSSSPRLKFKNEGAHVVLHFNEAPGTLTYDIKGDGFSGGTFTVMTSTDNNTYTALKTYTTLSNDVQHETFNTLSADIRYIKWIYTTKEDGKVALGNIGLTKVSSEPSITATNIALAYDDEEGEIAYTINNPVSGGEVSVEVIGTATWLYLDDVDETNYKVPFNCDANIGFERSATVRLTYTYNTDQTATKDVTITQAANPDPINNISEITAEGTYAVRGTIVAKSQRGFIVGDGTGYIYYYNTSYNQSAYNIGDKVKLSGSVVAYGKVFEFNEETVVTESATSNYDPANAYPTELTGAQMQNIVGSSTNRLSEFVVYHGTLSVSVSGNNTYYNITNISGATTATGSISYPLNTDFASLDGKQVTVIGYFVGVSSARYNTMIGEIVKTPSIVADDVTIQYNETSGSIAYSISDAASDGWFNAEVEDGSWITITQPIGNDAVAFTCEENTGDVARTETVTLTYSYQNNQASIEKTVTVTQDGAVVYYLVSFDCDGGTFDGNDDFPTISENKLAGEYTLPSATKSGLTFDGWKLDGTDDIYDAGAQYEVTGNVSFTAQWSSAVTGTITFGSAEGSTAINSTSVNGDDSAGNTWTITTVFSGQTSFTQNASYSQVGASSKPAESITFTTTLANEVNITAFSAKFGGFSNTAGDIALIVDETTIGTGSLNASDDVVVTNTTTESGTVLTVTVTNIAKGVKCYYISYTYEVDNTPSITVAPATLNLNCDGGDGELTVTYTNMPTDPQAEVIFYESNGETPLTENPTWITATINANGNVDGHIDANTGDARSAYFKVKGIDADGNDVYSGLVTVNQAAYTLSIVFETTSLDIEAGGEQDRIISFEYEGLGENPTFTVRQYDATGQTQTTYDWLTTTITDVHKVNITVAANTGDARSAFFKVYGENGTINTESNLVTINQAAAAPAGETFTLLTNVDQIVAGQHYLITNGSNKAMGVQNSNNRAAADVTISAGTATYEGDDVYEVVISGPDANGNYSIYDQRTPGYLFAASSGSNYLRTRAENSDNNSMWKITIDNEGVASIIAQGSNSRNVMRYNGGSSIFACYGSASQSPVYLFKKNDEKTYNFYSNTTVASLTVDNDGACIVHEDVALEVTGTITNNGGADNILIENLGQLINKNNVVATLQRDIKGYGDDPNVADGWQTIASPVDGISTSVVATAPYDLYMYNEPNAYWYSNTGSVPFNTLSRSIGYLYANANDMTLNFAGEMIRTDQVVPQTLSYTSNQTDDVRGYNLMGNPFTCNLNAGDIAWINGDAEYFTSYSIAIPTSANLVTYNINERPIKTGEGFFVQASDENQEISFVKTASKDGVANNGYISINANTEVNFDNAYIQIGNGNTLRKMSIATSSVVYVMNDGDDYAAARVEELAGSMPVYFDAAEDGQCTITITANNLVAHSMHLIDNFTGEDIDLLVNPSYTFFANESDDAARFTLMFDFNDYTGVNESYVNGNFAYQSGDELFISGDGTLQVFDVMGRFVMSKEIHGSETVSVSAFETGVYMLRFVGETVMTQKIVIR